MAKVKVKWKASENLIREELIQTGKSIGKERAFVLDLETLDPSTRERVLRYTGYAKSNSVSEDVILFDIDICNQKVFAADQGRYASYLKEIEIFFSAEPTLCQVLEAAESNIAAKDQAHQHCEKIVAKEKEEEAANEMLMSQMKSLFAAKDVQGLQALVVPTERMVSGTRAEVIWQGQKFISELQQEIYEQEKIAWIQQYGSEHLQRAMQRGCTTKRQYVIERAAIDAPGFVVDFNDAAGWNGLPFPSIRALDEADAADALGLGKSKIVLLTSLPGDEEETEDHEVESWSEEEDGFEPTEAIVISGYHGSYDLVKVL